MADNNGFTKTTTMPGTERKCPNCGGTLTYNANAQKLYCSLCGKYKEISYGTHEDVEVKGIAYNEIFNANSATPGIKCKILSCANCGAELIYDSAQVSGRCPFCGSTNIALTAAATSIMRPNGIIPFSIDEDKARGCFREHIKRKLFIPYKISHCTLDNLFPVYLPFFGFDANTKSSYVIEIGYYDSDGNIHYKTCNGTYEKHFQEFPLSASSKVYNSQVDKIRQFDPLSARPFNPDYMAGYYAERNSTSLKHGFEKVQYYITGKLNKLIPKDALRKFRGDRYRNLDFKTNYTDVTYKYILAPVYLASFTYKGKKYDVAINGSTGDVACDPPSARKFFIALFIILGIIAVGAFIAYLIYNAGI